MDACPRICLIDDEASLRDALSLGLRDGPVASRSIADAARKRSADAVLIKLSRARELADVLSRLLAVRAAPQWPRV